MGKRSIALFIACLPAAGAFAGGPKLQIVADSIFGYLVRIDPATGEQVLLDHVALASDTAEIALAPGLAGYAFSSQQVRTLDPFVNLQAPLGPIVPTQVRGAALDAAGALFYVSVDLQSGGSSLWTWSLASGAQFVAKIGPVPGAVQAIAFAPDGTLYGWVPNPFGAGGLIAIDRATGAVTVVNPAAGVGLNGGQIQFLAIHPDGTIYGGRSALYRISTVAGVHPVQIGPEHPEDLRSGGFVDFAAGFGNYGTGSPGALGVPSLTCSAAPVLGTTIDLLAGSSATATTPALLLVGAEPAFLPSPPDLTLWVKLQLVVPLSLPPGTTALTFSIPASPALVDEAVYVQSLLADPGAPNQKVAASRGLRLTLGS